ncbi:hypothetical protein GCM10009754_04090 [Amycolatopsis minnesotensis]|uniref:Uncharacterized protein n=2 Tax=Amycolatopsis minnesotensis TaxID=337894 RepID=A0ABP5BDS1_9PSEU
MHLAVAGLVYVVAVPVAAATGAVRGAFRDAHSTFKQIRHDFRLADERAKRSTRDPR